jgi:hypothetical protein
MANRINERLPSERQLGTYLKDRRTKLDPAAFGFPTEAPYTGLAAGGSGAAR